MTAQDRLKQYIEEDKIYNNYLTRKMNMSDFDKFCVQHCKDIEEILNEVQKLKGVIDKAIELLREYRHYSVPDEKQNSDNEDLVNKTFDILKKADR